MEQTYTWIFPSSYCSTNGVKALKETEGAGLNQEKSPSGLCHFFMN